MGRIANLPPVVVVVVVVVGVHAMGSNSGQGRPPPFRERPPPPPPSTVLVKPAESLGAMILQRELPKSYMGAGQGKIARPPRRSFVFDAKIVE